MRRASGLKTEPIELSEDEGPSAAEIIDLTVDEKPDAVPIQPKAEIGKEKEVAETNHQNTRPAIESPGQQLNAAPRITPNPLAAPTTPSPQKGQLNSSSNPPASSTIGTQSPHTTTEQFRASIRKRWKDDPRTAFPVWMLPSLSHRDVVKELYKLSKICALDKAIKLLTTEVESRKHRVNGRKEDRTLTAIDITNIRKNLAHTASRIQSESIATSGSSNLGRPQISEAQESSILKWIPKGNTAAPDLQKASPSSNNLKKVVTAPENRDGHIALANAKTNASANYSKPAGFQNQVTNGLPTTCKTHGKPEKGNLASIFEQYDRKPKQPVSIVPAVPAPQDIAEEQLPQDCPLSTLVIKDLLEGLISEVLEAKEMSLKGLLRDARKVRTANMEKSRDARRDSSFQAFKGVDAISQWSKPTVLSEKIHIYPQGKGIGETYAFPITTYGSKSKPVPKFAIHTTLQRNVLKDDEEMKYFPYFGDNEQLYDQSTLDKLADLNLKVESMPERYRRLEMLDLHKSVAGKYLSGVACSVDDLVHYLRCNKTLLPDEPTRLQRERELEFLKLDSKGTQDLWKSPYRAPSTRVHHTAKVCQAFFNRLGISLWDAMNVQSSAAQGLSPDKPKTMNSSSAEVTSVVQDYQLLSMDTYATLGCLICYMHTCPEHGYSEPGEERSLIVGPSLRQYHSKTAKSSPIWEDESGADCICGPNANLEAALVTWDQKDVAVLEDYLLIFKNLRKAACYLSLGLKRPCEDVYDKLVQLKYDARSTDVRNDPARHKQLLKRTEAIDLAETRTAEHEQRAPFDPCNHAGKCDHNCSCVKNNVACEKYCFCSRGCWRRFRGCSCGKTAKSCSTNGCACRRLNRECDVDLCGSCGAEERVDPDKRVIELAKKGCCNVNLQIGRPRRTLLGTSEVAGYGLFMGEAVKKGDYLGEYTGEVISTEEADLRGAIYDIRMLSYLFNLNAEQVVDATRAGNKFRFINDSRLSANCAPKVLLVNGVHRIAMFADQDLRAGDELFFDYNYSGEHRKFVSIEPKPRTTASRKSAPTRQKVQKGPTDPAALQRRAFARKKESEFGPREQRAVATQKPATTGPSRTAATSGGHQAIEQSLAAEEAPGEAPEEVPEEDEMEVEEEESTQQFDDLLMLNIRVDDSEDEDFKVTGVESSEESDEEESLQMSPRRRRRRRRVL